jgi:hypothetical protein
MNKLPAVPPSHPWSDDDDNDDAIDAQIQLAWGDALHWAKRGDYELLIAQLRGNSQIAREVRDFFADLLHNDKIKRSRGKPVKRPDKTFAFDESGQIAMVDKRDVRRLEIRKWVRENKPIHGDNVYAKAAKQFVLHEESVRDMVSRSSKAWKRRRST